MEWKTHSTFLFPCMQVISLRWLVPSVWCCLSAKQSDDTNAVKGDFFSLVQWLYVPVEYSEENHLHSPLHHVIADVLFPFPFSSLIGQHALYTLGYIATSFFGVHLTLHEILLMWLDVDEIILKLVSVSQPEAKKCVLFHISMSQHILLWKETSWTNRCK